VGSTVALDVVERPFNIEFTVPAVGHWYEADSVPKILSIPPGPEYQRLVDSVDQGYNIVVLLLAI
jgi:hypothetical protein